MTGATLAPETVRAIREAAAAWLAGRRFTGAPVLDHGATYAVAQAAGVLAGAAATDWHRAAWFACERELRAQSEALETDRRLPYAPHVRQVAHLEGAEYAVTATRPDPETGGTLLRLAPWPDRTVPDDHCRWVPMRRCAYVRTLTPSGWVTEACRPTD